MKIEKIQNTNNLQRYDPNGMFIPTTTTTFSNDISRLPTISVEKLSNNIIYVSDSEGDTHTITLDPKDILKLMTWLLGQEEARSNELTSLRKKVKAQKNQYLLFTKNNENSSEWEEVKEPNYK